MQTLVVLWAKWNVLLLKGMTAFGTYAAPILGASDAPGGEHPPAPFGTPVWGLPNGFWHIINFVILFGAIFWFAKSGIVSGVRTKKQQTAKAIEEATKLREEMRAKFEDYDARMKNIDERMNAIVGDARTEAEAEKARMVNEANALATRVRSDAKQVADQEIARAKRELQDEQIARAAELAEQILRASVTKEDQTRLSEEFLGKIAGQEKPA